LKEELRIGVYLMEIGLWEDIIGVNYHDGEANMGLKKSRLRVFEEQLLYEWNRGNSSEVS
jgi:hypothetical protein